MKKNNLRIELIKNILSLNIICTCGFKYTEEYLNNLTTLKLKSINNNPQLKIFEHDKDCLKTYKRSLTIKFCIKCGKEMSKREHSDTCKECRRIKSLTRLCKQCGKIHILNNGKEHFEYCDECWENNIVFHKKFNELIVIETDIRNNIYAEYDDISDLFFNKFFNKENKNTFNKSTDIINYQKLKTKKYIDICNILNEFINHLTISAIKYNWSKNTIHNLIYCLINVKLADAKGFTISSKTSKNIVFKTALSGWNRILNADFDSVILALQEFKFKSCEGIGEFFWILISKDIQCNYFGQADALYLNNSVGELKSAKSKSTAGRLLFKRDSWFGKNDFDTFKTCLINDLKVCQLNNQLLINTLNPIINNIVNLDVDKFSWNNPDSFYYQCIKQLKMLDHQLVNIFIKYIFNLTINHNTSFKPRFLDIDLSEKENFKAFHFINYCLYYILVDAKSENLDKLIFISDKHALVLNTSFLKTCTVEQFKKLIKNWEIAYPESGFTKKDNTSHDRNKDRAPGIFIIK